MNKYTYAQVLEASTEYFSGDELAAKVFVDKYALQNQIGEYLELTPTDMHKRLAKEFARIEAKYPNPMSEETIFNLLDKFKYIVPQGSPMFGIGNDHYVQSLGNCFVVESPYDSYGGILHTDQELTQLMKRRCVEENSLICTKEKSIIPIKDVKAGMHVLSFDTNTKQSIFKKVLDVFETEVKKEDRIIIKMNNGTILHTSKNHPILIENNNGFEYKNVSDLNISDICIKPELQNAKLNINTNNDIAWWIGAHLGDGTCEKRNIKAKRKNRIINDYAYRFRCNGDNENVIKHYAKIFNKLTSKSIKYQLDSRKDYKSNVWLFTSISKFYNELIEKYLDNQIGKKTYTCFVPSFIKENDLWMPFLAGLIDTDGHVKDNGQKIDITLASSNMISQLAVYLQSIGISCSTGQYQPKRINEHTTYKLAIHFSQELWSILSNLIHHDKKKKLLNEYLQYGKQWSLSKPLFDNEIINMLNAYQSIKFHNDKLDQKNRNLLSSNLSNIKKQKRCGMANLNLLETAELITNKKNIFQRNEIKSIEQDNISEKYFDISVEDTNNFYCGKFGLIVVHNCGVGVDISNIRPKGLTTNNAAKTTDGIGIFMERYSNTTREVAQKGRRGALMLSISINHPEIETFINIKKDLKKVTGANISIRITNEFMMAVKNNANYILRWPVESSIENAKLTKTIKAKDIWNQIIDCAWSSAEPGVLFWDHIINNSPADIYANNHPNFKTRSTNPCGELPLGLDSCRLLLNNLSSFVEYPFTTKAKFNFDKFAQIVQQSQRLMDDLIDLEIEKISGIIEKIKKDPEPDFIKATEIEMWKQFLESCNQGRRTGTGITALGDCLASLNIKYGSKQSIDIAKKIYKILAINAYKSSCIMAGERGSFPIFDKEKEVNHPFLTNLFNQDEELKQLYDNNGRRNISLLTTAPTGSVSMLTQTTSGIEPAFLLSYTRRKKINPSDKNAKVDFTDHLGDTWQEFTVHHHGLKQWMDITGETDIAKSPYYGATSNEIDWLASVEIQAAAQQYIDHSISKTCNLPEDTSKELVSDIYMKAWETGCKGFTIYRDKCRTGVLVSSDNSNKNDGNERPKYINTSMSPKRPVELPCEIKKVKIKGESWTVFVGTMNDKPYELFGGLTKYVDIPNKHKTGKIIKAGKEGAATYNLVVGEGDDEMLIKDIANVFEDANYGAFTRTISLALRHGAPIQYVVEQLQKDKHSDITSFSNVIARVLKGFISDGTKSASDKICPGCNKSDALIYQEGCLKCLSCGYSRC